MKPVVHVRMDRVHTAHFGVGPATVEARVALVGRDGLDGPRVLNKEWAGPDWRVMLQAKNPELYQHMLPGSVRGSWSAAQLASLIPCYYINNEGFQFWYPTAYALVATEDIMNV